MKKEQLHISYSALYELNSLVARLRINNPTYEDIERVQKIKELCNNGIQEHQGKVQEIFSEYEIEQLDSNHPKYKEINEKLIQLFIGDSSITAEQTQMYSKQEFTEGIQNPKVPFDGDDLLLMMKAFVKQEGI